MEPNDYAFPCIGTSDGLTKRELIAALLHAGILANPKTEPNRNDNYTAGIAIMNADALIKELSDS